MPRSITHFDKYWPRTRGWQIAAATVLVAALVLAACEAMGWSFMQGPLSTLLSKRLNVPLQFHGDFRLRLIGPPSLRTESLVVGAAQGVNVEHLLRAQDLHLGWRWSDAWRAARGGQIVIRHLTASQLQAELVREKDGRASWDVGTDKPNSNADMPWPRFELLRIDQGTVRLVDQTAATHLALSVNSAKSGQGFDAIAKGRFRSLPVDLTAHSDDPLALVQEDGDAGPVPISLSGSVGRSAIRFSGRASALLSARRMDGRLQLQGPSLAAVGEAVRVTLPETPPFELNADLTHDNGVWTFAADKMVVGGSDLGGDFQYDSRATPPMLSGRLTGRRLRLVDLGPAIGGDGPAKAPARSDTRPRRLLPSKKFDLPSLNAMNAQLDVDIAVFDLNTQALAPLSRLQTDLRLQNGVLTFNKLRAVAAGGTVAGSMQLDGRGDDAKWKADLALSDVDVARWLQVGRSEVSSSSRPVPYLSGKLAAKMVLDGTGQSTQEIVGSLRGQVDALIRNGAISHLLVELVGLDLAQSLGLLFKGDAALPMRCARTQLSLKTGVATIDRAVMDNADSTLAVSGSIDMRSETYALRAVAKPKDMSLFTLRSPLSVTGPWSAPNVSLEKERLAAKTIIAFVLGAIAPPAALLPFIDLGSDEKEDPCLRTAK